MAQIPSSWEYKLYLIWRIWSYQELGQSQQNVYKHSKTPICLHLLITLSKLK